MLEGVLKTHSLERGRVTGQAQGKHGAQWVVETTGLQGYIIYIYKY